uniref:Cytochrome b n=1 Tax=Mastigoproctus giganteus TaxID=58767 RepID=B1Q0G2_MASGI|nr:cytochrome b [Mastigoproctus giganteus]
MKKSIRKSHPLLKIINQSLIDFPSPSNISLMWSWGSTLGLLLMTQILTGIFLAIHFSGDLMLAFSSISHIMRDVNMGFVIRAIHANGASLMFIALYIHTARGIYYKSFMKMETWSVGVIILIISMLTAFLGYVLPWGQMSYWGATVITNLLSAIPYIGPEMVTWLWGGFSVENPTLTRFFTFHFIFPFILIALVIIHLMFLHLSGSSNPINNSSKTDMISFSPYFISKDMITFLFFPLFLIFISLIFPYSLMDPENFLPANPLVTPTHIQPEWYFLFAYSILRSIPNKLGGVIALIMSIGIIIFLPMMNPQKWMNLAFLPPSKIIFWNLITVIIILTWIGARPVEPPFMKIGQISTVFYFFSYFIFPLSEKYWSN